MKILLTLCACFCFLITHAQNSELFTELCGKTWYPTSYKETDGKIYPLDAETKALYTRFNCDGTYESWEEKGVLIKGRWRYDSASKKVFQTQTQNKKYPTGDFVEIVSCKGMKMAIKKRDGGGQWLTLYYIAK
jgi:hypothetical protein